MYSSGITAQELIETIKSETDISIPVPDKSYIHSINAIEQFIYSELLNEFVKVDIKYSEIENDIIPLDSLEKPNNTLSPIFDDVIRIFADGDEVERAGANAAYDFTEKNLFYNKYDNNITLSLERRPDTITVIFRIRPILKAENNINTQYVYVPIEFLDLVSSKVRGDVYKLVNEDVLSAKWLSEYNAQLESFKIWAAGKNQRFGG